MTRDPLSVLEQLAIAEELSSLVRHELRNRLGTIRNSSYFLKRRVERTELWASEPRVPKFFGLIEDEIVAADAVVNEKLGGSMLHARNVGPVSVEKCVARAQGTMRAVGEIDVTVDGLTVLGDELELALAIRALLENAVEAGRRATVTAFHHESAVRIVVADDGEGLDFEQGARPLFSTKEGRIGLGLNVAQRIARRHEGTLSNVPSGDRGARLVLELPAAPHT